MPVASVSFDANLIYAVLLKVTKMQNGWLFVNIGSRVYAAEWFFLATYHRLIGSVISYHSVDG